MQRLAVTLRKLRGNNITQAKLARLLGIGQPDICAYEKGRAAPERKTLERYGAWANLFVEEIDPNNEAGDRRKARQQRGTRPAPVSPPQQDGETVKTPAQLAFESLWNFYSRHEHDHHKFVDDVQELLADRLRRRGAPKNVRRR